MLLATGRRRGAEVPRCWLLGWAWALGRSSQGSLGAGPVRRAWCEKKRVREAGTASGPRSRARAAQVKCQVSSGVRAAAPSARCLVPNAAPHVRASAHDLHMRSLFFLLFFSVCEGPQSTETSATRSASSRRRTLSLRVVAYGIFLFIYLIVIVNSGSKNGEQQKNKTENGESVIPFFLCSWPSSKAAARSAGFFVREAHGGQIGSRHLYFPPRAIHPGVLRTTFHTPPAWLVVYHERERGARGAGARERGACRVRVRAKQSTGVYEKF